MTVLLLSWLTVSAGPDAFAGTVLVQGNALRPQVAVEHAEERVRCTGPMVPELQRLQSMRVEVVGHRTDDRFEVRHYRIIDIGGGRTPLVGYLQQSESRFVLVDGDQDAVPLSASSRMLARLGRYLGAKVWIHGRTLVSGELKIMRYGLLKRPPPPPRKAAPKRVSPKKATPAAAPVENTPSEDAPPSPSDAAPTTPVAPPSSTNPG